MTVDAKSNSVWFSANKVKEQLCYVEVDRLMDTFTLPFLVLMMHHREIQA